MKKSHRVGQYLDQLIAALKVGQALQVFSETRWNSVVTMYHSVLETKRPLRSLLSFDPPEGIIHDVYLFILWF